MPTRGALSAARPAGSCGSPMLHTASAGRQSDRESQRSLCRPSLTLMPLDFARRQLLPYLANQSDQAADGDIFLHLLFHADMDGCHLDLPMDHGRVEARQEIAEFLTHDQRSLFAQHRWKSDLVRD